MLSWIISSCVSVLVLRAFYRLYLHPLRDIPGPKLAAISHIYEFYYDVIKGGKYIWQIREMHNIYGPVVRINPREIHINDPEFYATIYAPAWRKAEKDPQKTAMLVSQQSVVATINHEHHRYRRSILNKYFSKRSVTAMEPLVQDKVAKMVRFLENACSSSTGVRLEQVFSATTADIITRYAYGVDFNIIDENSVKNEIHDATEAAFVTSHIARFFPFCLGIAQRMPASILGKLLPNVAAIIKMQHIVRDLGIATLQGEKPPSTGQTIFEALADPSLLPEERTVDRLMDEGFTVLTAGTETTARALATTLFYVANDNFIQAKLREEILGVLPTRQSTVTWAQLEQLPYLTGVIKEGLRLSFGAVLRTPRIFPDEVLNYKGHVIPPGVHISSHIVDFTKSMQTPISSSTYFMHMNSSAFAEPHVFDPERWTKNLENQEFLNTCFVPFQKGSRSCLGINLAYCELYLVVANVVRRFHLDVDGTTIEDISFRRDYMVPFPEKGFFAVKVRLRSVQ